MSPTIRIDEKKRMESDMRTFGDEMTRFEETHSDLINESDDFRRRYREISDRFQRAEEIGEGQRDEYLRGIRSNLESLRADYEKARSQK